MDVAIEGWRGKAFVRPRRRCLPQEHTSPTFSSRTKTRLHPHRTSSARSTNLDNFFTKQQSPTKYKKTASGDFIGRLIEKDSRHCVTLTKSNAEFREQGLEFIEGHENIDLESLNDLFVKVRFPRREPLRLQTALENSYFVLWIRYCKPSSRFVKEGQILGFARVLSDGVFYASIWDVAVLPSWQRNGLGRALIERLLMKLTSEQIPVISLYAERDVVGLYQKLGFVCDPEGISGMAYSLKP